MIDILHASYSFVSTLKKNDWVAVISYDMKPDILVDFTQDKQEAYGALNQLRIPGFSETNMFDALYDTLDRVDRIDGHKYIILVTTGIDSFSKLNLDQITKKVKTTKDVTIFPISIGWTVTGILSNRAAWLAPRGMGIPVTQIDYLQADNEMKTFARMTGGALLSAAVPGGVPGDFSAISPATSAISTASPIIPPIPSSTAPTAN